MDTIKDLFQHMERHHTGDTCYKVNTIPGMQHKLGKSAEGFPMFFVRTNESASPTANITRELLTVVYDRMCKVETEGTKAEHSFTIITLRSVEWSLQATFIDIVQLMLGGLQPMPSRKELAVEVEKLITIFSAMQRVPVKEIQGLWGELLVIERSKYPAVLVNAWHNSPKAKYDFTSGRDKIEVKTTSGENRIHQFSLDQLNPSPSSRLLVASMTVRESAQVGGRSVKDLFEAITAKVGTIEQFHLYKTLAETMGNSFTKWNTIFFDYTEASDSLKFFRAEDIPRINKTDVPAGVTDVKFRSCLDGLQDAFSDGRTDDYKSSTLFKSIH